MPRDILNMTYEWLFQVWWEPSKMHDTSAHVMVATPTFLLQAAVHQPQQPRLFHHEPSAAKPYAST